MVLSFKKSVCLLIAAVFVFSTAACGLNLPEKKPDTKTETSGTPSMVLVSGLSPKETVDKAFDAMIKLDGKTFEQYIQNDGKTDKGIVYKDNKLFGGNMDDNDKELVKSLVSKFSYKVISSNEQGDRATVKVQITNRDLSGIFQQIIIEGTKEDFDDGKLVDLINKTDKTKQFDVDIKLKIQDNQWKIGMTEDLVNALMGGAVPGWDKVFGSDEDGWPPFQKSGK